MNRELFVYNGKITTYDPELPSVSPDWSPVNRYGGYHNSHAIGNANVDREHGHEHMPGQYHWIMGADGRGWQTGCGCGV